MGNMHTPWRKYDCLECRDSGKCQDCGAPDDGCDCPECDDTGVCQACANDADEIMPAKPWKTWLSYRYGTGE